MLERHMEERKKGARREVTCQEEKYYETVNALSRELFAFYPLYGIRALSGGRFYRGYMMDENFFRIIG